MSGQSRTVCLQGGTENLGPARQGLGLHGSLPSSLTSGWERGWGGFTYRDVPTYVCLDGCEHWGPKAIWEQNEKRDLDSQPRWHSEPPQAMEDGHLCV